ncbi:TetR/AcrR family transcriptional regulator [Herbaspirillum seropedicae]|uniref:TetR/AcrR family transcriptional regulator n=1 Tax=Herbaspirillum seropedicae TaxID=964 RepID=UPI003FCE0B50
MMVIMQSKPTRKQVSHDRIVDVASRAIRRAGANGVGVADIMKEAGLTHGGFYAHFESRNALVSEAIRHAWQDTSQALTNAMARRVAAGESRFAALVNCYLHDSHLEKIEQGCVIAALSSEMTRLDEAARGDAKRLVAQLIALARSCLPPGCDPANGAIVASTMTGALQLARTLGGKQGRELLALARKQLINQFDPVLS